MGCLRLTYEETPALFLEREPEKTDTPKWHVWTNPNSTFWGVGEVVAQQGDPQTWYYMWRDVGSAHGMVYDPVGNVIYEVNQVPGQSIWGQIERLIINSYSPDFAQAKVSIA